MIINRKATLKPILTLAMTMAATTAMAFSSSYYHNESVLKSGHWVKVKVTENGIHQFTYDQLRDMGFSDPSRVSVFGYGGASLWHNTFKTTDPDDLPQLYVLHTTDGRVLFYGEGASRAGVSTSSTHSYELRVNNYSTAGYYFLTDKAYPKPVERVARDASNVLEVNTHTAIDFRDINQYNPAHAGAHFFGPSFNDVKDQSINFPTADAVSNGNGYVAYVGVCKHQFSNSPSFQITLDDDINLRNGSNIPGGKLSSSIAIFCKVSGYQFFNLRTGSDASTTYKVNVAPITLGNAFDYAALDWVYFSYARHNTLGGQSQRRMTFPRLQSTQMVSIADSRADLEVWDVTSPFNIRRFNTLLTNNGQVQFTPDRSYNTSDNPALNVVAFHPSGTFPTPEVVGVVENQDLHALPVPHMLIITNNECEAAANRLARAHQEIQGIDVVVVNQEKIFNEFSSGTPDAMAYRRIAKMFYDRDPSKFRSLLLFGRGCYDNRRFVVNAEDALLTYQVEDYTHMGGNATNYTSDVYFGMLNDYFNPNNIIATKADIAVGRIPATKADISTTVDKIVDYLATPVTRPYRNRALLIADDNDANKHEVQSDHVMDTLLTSSPQITCVKVYNNVYPWTDKGDALIARSAIIQSLTQGQDYVCYTGHASATGFTSEFMWHKSYVASTQYSHMPIWMLATCDTYAFDRLDDGIAERMLYQPQGGAIAVVGACRTVYADSNFILSMEMANAYARSRGRTTIGKIFTDARNATVARAELNLRVNTMCYNLAGDPEIPYYAPDLNVTVSKINDIDAVNGAPLLYPLANNVIEGEVRDTDGNIRTNFNGTVTLTLCDGPETIKSSPKDGKSDPRDVYFDETLLTEYTTTVTNGRFSAEISFPHAMRPNTTNRLTLYAVNSDASLSGVGMCDKAVVTDYDPSKRIDDNTAPVIESCYLDTPTFNDGDEVSSSPTFFARISDSGTGVNMIVNALSAGVNLTLDDNKSFPNVRTAMSMDSDGGIDITFPLSDLSDGRHSLTLNIADNAGNRASRTINFTVVDRAIKSSLFVDKEAVRDQVTFDINHTFTSEPTGRLVIEDPYGNVVFSLNNCTFPYVWNLVDNNGQDVADGTYHCYAALKAAPHYSNTERVNVVVIK